jgi:hypothetical protein
MAAVALVAGLCVAWGFSYSTVQGQSSTPTITAVSGTWNHGSTVTIQGSGFGTKPTAAPMVWDDCSGTNPLAKWDGVLPNTNDSTTYQMTYRTPMRGVSPPHNRVGKYLAGGHGCASLACADVAVWKNRTFQNPSFSYVSWYIRADPGWVFGQDNNFKNSTWATGSDAPYGQPYWYTGYNAPFTSVTSSGSWSTNSLPGGQYNWGETATNPYQQWAKIEMMVRWSTGSDGFIRIYDNGRLVFTANGPSDFGSGSARTEMIGGYGRMYGQPTNWRYFADLYLDSSLAHVIIGNAPTLAASTRREVQIPTSWSGSSLSVRVNLGAFSTGQQAYLYVYDANGVANSNGYPITVGGGSGSPTPPPAAPGNVRIIR